MKKLLLSIAFLCAMLTNAQTIETKSSCDSNNDGKVDITDVTNTANKVLGKVAAEKQVVTAEDLNALLKIINEKLDKLEKLSSIESRLSTIEAKIGIESFDEPSTDPSLENGHDYVDLGLSVKWATMNVGATEVAGSKTNSHTGQLDCYGEYYAWGETSPKDSYDWENLKYCSGTTYKGPFTKYVASSSYGTPDNKTTLELADDAARANWGGSWRMPTYAERDELLDNCYWEWTTSYNDSGVKGYIVYKVKNASDKGKKNNTSSSSQTPTTSYSLSDTHIFLPASGCCYGSNFEHVGSNGLYWSSSLNTFYRNYACGFYFDSEHVDGDGDRCIGRSVRAVCP